jgi:hypothetical protein
MEDRMKSSNALLVNGGTHDKHTQAINTKSFMHQRRANPTVRHECAADMMNVQLRRERAAVELMNADRAALSLRYFCLQVLRLIIGALSALAVLNFCCAFYDQSENETACNDWHRQTLKYISIE